MLPLCVGGLLAINGVAACSEKDNESEARTEKAVVVANEPPGVFVERIAKLLETVKKKGDCSAVFLINIRSQTRFDCPADKSQRRSMAAFERVGAESYGTGGVVDYRSGEAPEGAAVTLYVDPNGDWGVGRFGIVTDPSTAKSDADSRDGYAKAADDYLTAVRERDCKAFKDVAFSTSDQKVCSTSFVNTKSLAKRLRTNPAAAPRYVGGNGTFGFLTLETAKPKPEASTISVIRAEDGAQTSYIVLDVTPSPTAARQRALVRARKARDKGANPNMEPSTKPSDPAVEDTQ
jgi:hypothetical protein